jgi:NTE family protein
MSNRSGVGLILGGGGASGAAFHAGTLLALELDLGWSPQRADVIVGTSAGSIVGGLLRAGLTTDDLAAWASSVKPLPSGRAGRELLDRIEADPFEVRPSRPRLPVPSWEMVTRAVRPGTSRLHTVAMALLPDGWLDTRRALEQLGSLVSAWPGRPLWIPAVRTSDARRVVFGRDVMDASLGEAIAASCAIPGLFRPVQVGTARYIDGGAHSPTNADLLADSTIHTALILSPMTGDAQALNRWRPDHLVRARLRRRLLAECRTLERAGIEVHVLEPDARSLATMGINMLDHGRSPDVLRDAFLACGGALATRRALCDRLEADVRTRAANAAPTSSPGFSS